MLLVSQPFREVLPNQTELLLCIIGKQGHIKKTIES